MAAFLEIVWERESTAAGEVSCSHCGGERPATLGTVRSRVAVFGRPVLVLGGPATYRTCDDCGRTWDGSSGGLSGRRGERPVSADERALAAVVAAVVFSDLSIRPTEKRMVRWVIRRYTGASLDDPGVDRLLRTARTRWGDPLARLRKLACVLDGRAKRRIVGAAYLVCAADRELHPQESRLLVRIGDALEMSPRDVRSAMEEAKEELPVREAPPPGGSGH